MKQTYDIEGILFYLLSSNVDLKGALTGGIYPGQRPDNSELEDIVLNTISLTQNYPPQLATSNVNIHVPDMSVEVNNIQQKVENRTRLKDLTEMVLETIRTANVAGLKMQVESQTIIDETDINQHYSNIRITWNIHS